MIPFSPAVPFRRMHNCSFMVSIDFRTLSRVALCVYIYSSARHQTNQSERKEAEYTPVLVLQ